MNFSVRKGRLGRFIKKKKKPQNYLHNLVEAFAGLQTNDLEVGLVRKVGFRE